MAGTDGGSGRSIIISALSADFDKAVQKPMDGKLNPYIELELSGTRVQTKTAKRGGLSSLWEASDGWVLYDQGGHPFLMVQAFNRHLQGKETFLGEGQIALEDLFHVSDTNRNVPLKDAKGSKIGVFHFNVREHVEESAPAPRTPNRKAAAATGAACAASVGAAAYRQKRAPTTVRETAASKTSAGGPTTQMFGNEQQGKRQFGGSGIGAGSVGGSAAAGMFYSKTMEKEGRRMEQGGLKGSDMDADAVAGGSGRCGGMGAAVVGGEGGRTGGKSFQEVVDENVNREESSTCDQESSKTVTTVDTRDLETSEEHWQQARELTLKAREQASIVEVASIESTILVVSLTETKGAAAKARQQQKTIEARLAELGLEEKRAAAARAKHDYDATVRSLEPLQAEELETRRHAALVVGQLKDKSTGLQELQGEVDTKQSTLTESAAALASAQDATAEAERRAHEKLAQLAPLREDHKRSLVELNKLEAESGELQQYLAEVESLRMRNQSLLDSKLAGREEHTRKFASLEPLVAQQAQQVEVLRGELASLASQQKELDEAAKMHELEVQRMNRETLVLMEEAKREKAAADAQGAALTKAEKLVRTKEGLLMERKQALEEAKAQSGTLRTEVQQRESSYLEASRFAQEMQHELTASKRYVDVAQARKEELWHQAKMYGESAEKASNAHFARLTKARRALLA